MEVDISRMKCIQVGPGCINSALAVANSSHTRYNQAPPPGCINYSYEILPGRAWLDFPILNCNAVRDS